MTWSQNRPYLILNNNSPQGSLLYTLDLAEYITALGIRVKVDEM